MGDALQCGDGVKVKKGVKNDLTGRRSKQAGHKGVIDRVVGGDYWRPYYVLFNDGDAAYCSSDELEAVSD